jgi:hypothetical protein
MTTTEMADMNHSLTQEFESPTPSTASESDLFSNFMLPPNYRGIISYDHLIHYLGYNHDLIRAFNTTYGSVASPDTSTESSALQQKEAVLNFLRTWTQTTSSCKQYLSGRNPEMRQRLIIGLRGTSDMKATERGKVFLASLFSALWAHQRKENPGIGESEVVQHLIEMATNRWRFEYGTSRTEQEWEEYVTAERERVRRFFCLHFGKGSEPGK